jgi:hypothetical protein
MDSNPCPTRLPKWTRTHVPHAEERNLLTINHTEYLHLKSVIRTIAPFYLLIIPQHVTDEYARYDLLTLEITWISTVQLHPFTNNAYTIHY